MGTRPTGKLARDPAAELRLTPWVMEADGLMLGDQGLGSLGEAPSAGWVGLGPGGSVESASLDDQAEKSQVSVWQCVHRASQILPRMGGCVEYTKEAQAGGRGGGYGHKSEKSYGLEGTAG